MTPSPNVVTFLPHAAPQVFDVVTQVIFSVLLYSQETSGETRVSTLPA